MKLAVGKYGSEKQIRPLKLVGNLCDRVPEESFSNFFLEDQANRSQHAQR